MKKTASLAAALLFVGFGTTACGGSKGSAAPEDASKEDFCTALAGFADSEDESKLQDHVDDLTETGTPSDISDDARKGFEYMVDNAKKIDESDPDLDQAVMESEFGVDVVKQVTAFGQYYLQTCMGDEMQDLQDQMDDLPSDSPS